MDGIKEILDALNTRIRSPIFGSIVIVFLLWNWKPLFYLAFSNSTVGNKFIFFEANTTFWSLTLWPIVLGVVFALASPWIAWFGSWAVEAPTRKRRLLQTKSRHEILTEKAALKETRRQMQSTREQAIIDAAKIDQEVAEIDDEKIREDTKKTIEASRQKDDSKTSSTSASIVNSTYARAKNTIEDQITSLNHQRYRYEEQGEVQKVKKIEEQLEQAYERLNVITTSFRPS